MLRTALVVLFIGLHAVNMAAAVKVEKTEYKGWANSYRVSTLRNPCASLTSLNRKDRSDSPKHQPSTVNQGTQSWNRLVDFATYPSLCNRVIMITGGAIGIGGAIVEALARQSYVIDAGWV
jgi:hypothetical protein